MRFQCGVQLVMALAPRQEGSPTELRAPRSRGAVRHVVQAGIRVGPSGRGEVGSPPTSSICLEKHCNTYPSQPFDRGGVGRLSGLLVAAASRLTTWRFPGVTRA